MKPSRLAGVLAVASSENGARMPSTADDVLAEIRSAALRLASLRLRRYGLDSLSVMVRWYSAEFALLKRNLRGRRSPDVPNRTDQA
jgi:hypothetical protein